MRLPDPRVPLVAGALGGLVAAQQPWGEATGVAATSGLAQALPLAALGGVLLTLTLAPPGRRAVGVLVALVAVGMVAVGVQQPSAGWALAYAAAGLIAAASAGLLAAKPGVTRRTVVPSPRAPVEDSLASWKAMDEGLDPTEDGTEREDLR